MFKDTVRAIDQGQLKKYSKEELINFLKLAFASADIAINTANYPPVLVIAIKIVNIFQSTLNLNVEE